MHDYTLVIVDVQSDFWAARHKPTLKAIKREVKLAKKRRLPIVVMEVHRADGMGKATATGRDLNSLAFLPPDPARRRPVPKRRTNAPTHPKILQELDGYDRKIVVFKGQSDGSLELIMECHRLQLERPRFRLCGVNTDVCVLKTALGLAELRPLTPLEIVQDACNTEYEQNCWDRFRVAPNIVLLPTGT